MSNLKRNETQLVCIAEFKALPGEADLLLKNLHSLIKFTHLEGGCIRYELNQSIETPEEITFIEKWYDQETFDDKFYPCIFQLFLLCYQYLTNQQQLFHLPRFQGFLNSLQFFSLR